MWLGRTPRAQFGRRFFVALLLSLAVGAGSAACGGRSEKITLSPGEETGGTSSGSGGGGNAGRGGSNAGGRDAGMDPGDASVDGSDGGDEVPIEDPGCPDEPAPEGVVECDIFGTPTGCPEGTGCYPDLEHPFGEGCDQQTLNIVCRLAGTGVEGDLCGNGTGGCAPGYTCIVGAQAGKRCLRICSLDGALGCPAGAVCGATDAFGIGVCA
jgi:hypothetical protein